MPAFHSKQPQLPLFCVAEGNSLWFSTKNCEIHRNTSAGRKFALVEGLSHDLVCTGSIYHVHFAWQVWHGQLSPRFKFDKLKSFSGVEIDQNDTPSIPNCLPWNVEQVHGKPPQTAPNWLLPRRFLFPWFWYAAILLWGSALWPELPCLLNKDLALGNRSAVGKWDQDNAYACGTGIPGHINYSNNAKGMK